MHQAGPCHGAQGRPKVARISLQQGNGGSPRGGPDTIQRSPALNSTRRHLLAACAALGLAFTATASHAQDALKNIQQAKTIRIAVPTDFPPYGFVGTDLQP